MKRQNVKIILVEPYFDLKTPQLDRAARPARKVLVLPPSVGGEKEITDYIKLFDYDVNLLVAAHQGRRERSSMDCDDPRSSWPRPSWPA